MRILSGLICIADIGRTTERVISPIYDPALIAEFVVISPARRMLSTPAQLFLEAFEAEIARIQEIWAETIPPAVYPVRAKRNAHRSAVRNPLGHAAPEMLDERSVGGRFGQRGIARLQDRALARIE